jgi:hypothetical protein
VDEALHQVTLWVVPPQLPEDLQLEPRRREIRQRPFLSGRDHRTGVAEIVLCPVVLLAALMAGVLVAVLVAVLVVVLVVLVAVLLALLVAPLLLVDLLDHGVAPHLREVADARLGEGGSQRFVALLVALLVAFDQQFELVGLEDRGGDEQDIVVTDLVRGRILLHRQPDEDTDRAIHAAHGGRKGRPVHPDRQEPELVDLLPQVGGLHGELTEADEQGLEPGEGQRPAEGFVALDKQLEASAHGPGAVAGRAREIRGRQQDTAAVLDLVDTYWD